MDLTAKLAAECEERRQAQVRAFPNSRPRRGGTLLSSPDSALIRPPPPIPLTQASLEEACSRADAAAAALAQALPRAEAAEAALLQERRKTAELSRAAQGAPPTPAAALDLSTSASPALGQHSAPPPAPD